MLRGQDVSVDSHSPPLISPYLHVAIDAIDQRCQLGAQQEDVDTTEGGYLVEDLDDGLLEVSNTQVGDHVPVNVDRGTALVGRE